MASKRLRNTSILPITVLLILAVFVMSSCSVRSYQIKKAESLYKKGQALQDNGHLQEAISRFKESMALSEKTGFRPGVANNLNEIAIIHTSLGEYGKARELLSRALRIYREMNWKTEVSKSMNNIALTWLKEREFHKAIEAYKDLLDWDQKTGNRLGRIITLNNLGFIYEHYLKDRVKAQKSYEEALRIARELGNRKYIRMLEEKVRE